MPEGLSKYEWEFFMECMYDTMPRWYWNTTEREKEYQRYKGQSNERLCHGPSASSKDYKII